MTTRSILKYLIAMLASAPLAASASTVRIYVTNSAGDSIDIIDPATNTVVDEIKDVVGAHGIAFSPDASRVYVSNEETSTLDVYDRKSDKLVKKVPLSGHPNNISVTKNGDRIVIAIAHGKGGLDIVDAATLTLNKTIPANGGRLHNVYVTPDNKYVVGGSIPSHTFYVFDLAKEQLAWALPMDLGVRCMAIETNADGSTKRVFSQLSTLNGFAVIDFAQQKEAARITLPSVPQEFDHGGYRSNEPSHGIGIAPDDKTLWVTSIPNNAVYEYALADLKLIGKVDLPSETIAGRATPLSAVANWVTFTPDGKALYVSNSGLRSVSVIDTAAMKVVKVIPVGEVPKRNNTLVIPDEAPRASTAAPSGRAATQ
ncbi:MAG TPA: cytochrome D1 domain-containing protein [Xanthobacteraceae bacterium]|jgi:YVTN family beta-propeller protein